MNNTELIFLNDFTYATRYCDFFFYVLFVIYWLLKKKFKGLYWRSLFYSLTCFTLRNISMEILSRLSPNGCSWYWMLSIYLYFDVAGGMWLVVVALVLFLNLYFSRKLSQKNGNALKLRSRLKRLARELVMHPLVWIPSLIPALLQTFYQNSLEEQEL